MVYIRDRRKRPAGSSRSSAAANVGQLDEVFFALSHAARRQLIARLGALGDQPVAALASPLAQSPAQITKHLAILERAGLITREIAGRQHVLHLERAGIRPALDWIHRHRKFWSEGVDRLEAFLDSAGGEKT